MANIPLEPDPIRSAESSAAGANDGTPSPVPTVPVRDGNLEEQFRLLVDSVAEYAIFLLDTSGHVCTWNKGAERIKGYAANEILGKHFSIFYTPQDVLSGHPLDELALATTHGRYEEEGWRLRKDGSQFWANVVITALRDRTGTLCGFGKVTRDFTERKRAEQQLQRSEERFRHLVQGVQDYAILMLDGNGCIASWNEGAARITGFQAHEILGRHFSCLYTEADNASGKPASEIDMASREGRFEEDGWRVRKDGALFWATTTMSALRDDSGAPYGFATVIRDSTEQRRAENLRMQTMGDALRRSFLRDVLSSVTEGRLRYVENESELPDRLPQIGDQHALDRDSLAELRRSVAAAAASVGIAGLRISDIVTASSEAGMNAVVHADGASCAMCGKPGALQIWIVDGGAGIEIGQLHRATLERGFTTKGSFGHGFWLMLHACDRLWLLSTSTGTTIVLEIDAFEPEPKWAAGVQQISPPVPSH